MCAAGYEDSEDAGASHGVIKAATILAGGMPSAVRQWAGPDSSAQAAVAAEDFLSGCYAVDPAAVLSKKARCAHTLTSPPWPLIRRLRWAWRIPYMSDCVCLLGSGLARSSCFRWSARLWRLLRKRRVASRQPRRRP